MDEAADLVAGGEDVRARVGSIMLEAARAMEATRAKDIVASCEKYTISYGEHFRPKLLVYEISPKEEKFYVRLGPPSASFLVQSNTVFY